MTLDSDLRTHIATPSANATPWPSDEALALSTAVLKCVETNGMRHDAPRDLVHAPCALVPLLP